jgi:diguanylate cyclase (GGDEF)-like protein
MNTSGPSGAFREARGKKLRVLVAEVEGGRIAKLLESLFANGADSLELTSVSNEMMLLPTIRLAAPEVVFLDLGLFPGEPISALRGLRRAIVNIPLITAANFADKAIAERSLQEGATDYILKECADEISIERVLRSALERNTVAGLTDLLRDPQTEAYNREGFLALAQKAVQEAQRCGSQLILLTARLINLHALGEEFGPSGAEQGVKDVAELLRGAFRRTDVIARLGEGEFAVLAMDAPEPSVAVMVQRVERHLIALNKARAPWGELDLAVEGKFWSPKKGNPASELLAFCQVARVGGSPQVGSEPRREATG